MITIYWIQRLNYMKRAWHIRRFGFSKFPNEQALFNIGKRIFRPKILFFFIAERFKFFYLLHGTHFQSV